MPLDKLAAWRIAYSHWVSRVARTVPMYTDEALKVLGLPATASVEDAKKAFRTLIMIHHPDRGGDIAKAVPIIEAWTQLKDGVTISRPNPTSGTYPGSGYRSPPPRTRPRPPPPPPPRPPPRKPEPPPAQPSQGPSSKYPPLKVTWKEAERATKVPNGTSQPEAKDRQRAEDLIKKAAKVPGYAIKMSALANQMANSIDSVAKALRRGRAFEDHDEVPGIDIHIIRSMSQIFYTRAMTLARVAGA